MKSLSILLLAIAPPLDDARGRPVALEGQDDFKPKWKESYDRAATFLLKGQGADGLWGREFQGRRWPSMALTVLSVDALARMPQELRDKHKAAIDKSIALIEKSQDEKDGSWAEPPGQLKAYVTSLAIMALNAHDPARHKARIERGQKYLAALQITEGFELGGSGYGEKELKEGGVMKESKSANLGTTKQIAEALSETGYDNKEYWARMVKFLEKCQNNSETNIDPEWLKTLESKGFKVGNDGGFVYKLDPETAENYGGVAVGADGKKTMTSYGSMTYEGLQSYLYAGLTKDDRRVKDAVEWARKNYTVERHPGFPYEKDMPAAKRKDNQGLFFYYMAMARALDAWGERPFVTDDGKKRNWPKDLAEKLMSLQKPDGSWLNEQVRWWEGDAMLVTPYVLKVYSILAKHLSTQ